MEMESPQTLAYRTPLEDSFVEISTALSIGHHFEHGALTASLGVASLLESVGASDELVTGAYPSVAEAKRGGGNRVGAL
jgi:PleD family two-component response regulator